MKTKIKQLEAEEEYELTLDDSSAGVLPKKKARRVLPDSGSWYVLGMMGEVGFTIAIPIAGGALLGAYLDRIWSSYPRATLSFLFVGLIVSLIGFVRTIRDIVKKGNKQKI